MFTGSWCRIVLMVVLFGRKQCCFVIKINSIVVCERGWQFCKSNVTFILQENNIRKCTTKSRFILTRGKFQPFTFSKFILLNIWSFLVEYEVNVDNSSASSFGILDTFDFRKCWFCCKECGFNVSKHFVHKNQEKYVDILSQKMSSVYPDSVLREDSGALHRA